MFASQLFLRSYEGEAASAGGLWIRTRESGYPVFLRYVHVRV